MGIYIDLKEKSYFASKAIALERLEYCREAIQFFSSGLMFRPDRYKIFLNGPSEALGGQLKEDEIISDVNYLFSHLSSRIEKHFFDEELFRSIMVFEGVWNIDGINLDGFFSVNNHYGYKNIYKDIEIDAYGKGKYGDLVEVFWDKNQIELLVELIDRLKSTKHGLGNVSRLYFTIGVPEDGYVDNVIAIYFHDRYALIKYLYNKLKKDGEDWFQTKLTPISSTYFLKTLKEEELVTRSFELGLKNAEIVEKAGASSIFIAKSKDSFRKFYDYFKEEVFKAAAQELPASDHLRLKIRQGLEKKKGHYQTTIQD